MMSNVCAAPRQKPWLLCWLYEWLPAPVRLLVHHRHILWATTWNDIRGRFAGSVLGLTWLFLYPLLLLGAYAAVYIYIFKVRFALFDTANDYVALIFCGLIPFLGFSEALATGVSSVTGNAHLVKNTLFPVELIPVKSVLASQCTQLGGTVLLLVALGLLGRLTPWAVLIIPVWLCQISFTIGLVWVLSSLNVYFRDLQNVVSVLVLVLMMVSPIAYTPDMVPAGLRCFLAANPLYYLISAYQQCLMFGRPPPTDILLPLLGLAAGALLLGHLFFRRLKQLFADNI
jgi:lipopolysaccharide transport system permease protein